MPRRLAVIGAGPIGIAAALGAIDRGFETTLLERGDVGDALRSWGATRFFTPLSMNITPRMHELLGSDAPARDALLTGREMIEHVLHPLTQRDPLRSVLRTRTAVTAIGRRGLTKSDYAGHPIRAEKPFRIVAGDDVLEADVVLDATGGYAAPNSIGGGGLPARGERTLNGRAIRTLGDLDARRPQLRGKRVLLVGDGHSAANALLVLTDSGAEVTWAVRGLNRKPVVEIANDPLPERERVVAAANALVDEVRMERRATVEALEEDASGLDVTLTGGRRVSCDYIAAFTGFHPDASLHRELNVEISPVTDGTAKLYRAIASITDCLSVPRLGLADLESGEPGFFFIGSRSYGRANTFLLQTGLAQLATILDSLAP